LEQLRVEKGKFDNLSQFANLFTETSDFGVGDISGVFVGHVVDEGVDLARQVPHDGQGGHVQCNSSAGLQLGFVQLTPTTYNVSRTVSGFDDEFLFGELSQNFTHDLSDALQRLQVVLRLVVGLGQGLELFPETSCVTDCNEEDFKTTVLSKTRLHDYKFWTPKEVFWVQHYKFVTLTGPVERV
jgi:hypothetical protein